MSQNRITASYFVETPFSLDDAAAAMAGEQSTGTFTRVPGETEALRERFAARVETMKPLDPASEPSLPGAALPPDPSSAAPYQRGEVTLSFPLENMGMNFPTLFSTVCGNLFELRQLSGLRLLDITLPTAYADAFPGPQFGIDGTRRLVDVYDRPIIGTIVKPSVGLSPAQTADLTRQLGEADIDFIKDDELMGNPPHAPLPQRVKHVMRVVDELADRRGKKLMFAFNISDQLDEMLRHHDTVHQAGGTCVMVSLNSVGLVAVEHLRRRCQLPIHGHRNGWGMFTRCPELGMEFTAYQKFWRLVGVDHLHVNGLKNKFAESDDSVVQSIRACLTPFLGGFPVMPVVSSGQWGGQAPETFRRTQTVDCMYLAGGGILAHPGGPAAGVTAIRQAWEAAVQGIRLQEYAADRGPLRQSLEKYGKMAHAQDDRS